MGLIARAGVGGRISPRKTQAWWRAGPQERAAMARGGGGGGGAGLQDIVRKMQAAQEKANLANVQRYRQILGQFEGLGKAGRARIEQQTLRRQAEATQSLTSRGLGGTTITSAVERGIAGEAETQRQQLEESIAVQKAGVMERRTDVGPDLGMFAGLLQAAGQQQRPRQRRVTTRMGPMAAAGRTVFGTPFQYR